MRENRGSMNRLHLCSVFAGLMAKMQKSQAFRFYARRVRRKVGEKKKTNKRARTDAEQGLSVSDWAKGDKAFSFGRALLLKVEARYTCGLRAFGQEREKVFNTLIKSRLRIVHEAG